jgi:hypothetical protein
MEERVRASLFRKGLMAMDSAAATHFSARCIEPRILSAQAWRASVHHTCLGAT